jgi:hypothetical protein
VIWTDEKELVLAYICLSNGLKTWALYSTNKENIDPDTKRFILAKIADYGFDPVKSWETSYSRCQHL